jgi:biopolymer transport protein ExbD
MKATAAKQVHYDSGPNMTPLVDVVMVILIFLMLAGSFGTGEKYMIATSRAHGGPQTTSPEPQPLTIELRINENGGVRVPWQTGAAITDNAALKDELEQRLAKVLRENAGVGTTASNVELILRPDAGVEWDKLAPVYDVAVRAKYEKIGFAPAAR